jgi:hypothetical protein
MVDGNGSASAAVSYQQYDGASGSYQDIPTSPPPRSPRMKWILGAVLVAVLGIVYTVLVPAPSAAVVNKEMAKSGLQVKADGKVKLFDEFSKCFFFSSSLAPSLPLPRLPRSLPVSLFLERLP